MTAALDTYAELRLAEGKLLRWGERESKAACALQPRDLEILVALARYRFLTTGQIAELWWAGRGLRAVRRRLTRLFEAGFVERFRPQTLRGSYQWTYCLARDGFRAAQQTGELADRLKFAPRREAIFDYRYVIHDLRTNEWVLRYRELLGERLLDWAGPDESRYDPPKKRRDEEYFSRATAILGDCGWYADDVPDEDFRPVQPDALLDVAATGGDAHVFVEYDRTRRVDKNFDKFLRYQSLLVVWWRETGLGYPYVIFVCQDAEHRRRFVYAADSELTGHLNHGVGEYREERFTARDRMLFALEGDIREGKTTALALPAVPPRHDQRTNPASVRHVPLPGLEA
jgi:predicted transcriptional regulator